jgi:glycine oxidase
MGCASALALAGRGAEVVLLERAVPGAEASSAAAGILGAQLEARENEGLVGLFVRARAEYVSWAERLRAQTGIDVGHRVTGALRVAVNDREAGELAREAEWHKGRGLRAELLDARAALSLEPQLATNVAAALHFPDESQVDPPALLRALVAAVTRRHGAKGSVTVRTGTTVERLVVEAGRCVGVALEDGEERADAVVLAAGSWSSLVPGVPASVPKVRPARGQIVLLDERPPTLRTMLFGTGGYVVPRGDGRVLCGSTFELVGHRREVTAGGVSKILSGALALAPGLEAATLAQTWSSFRPYLGKDSAPLIGASPLPGLVLATGHHRNGILLAKVTADAVAGALFG